ncbi:PAS domain-containing sensor histidine kinase [Agrobacterium vitis]|uniref:PAS domain-containing sensor histidine kinase n=1 Tax=Agrobacterium vitis TaxID=373 RepID=UPI0020359582|nr:PAS domain-containing sensor histidine kinase [Agrobacterium vitis]MCM2450104.1 PAS domain-containing sensor histidine kinase [Agrobacterium vitis]
MSYVPDHLDLFENAPCGYVVTDSRGRILTANRTLANWLDVSDGSLLGKRFLDLMPVSGRIFYETHFAPLLRIQGFFHEVAVDLVKSDKSKLSVLANATQDGEGEEAVTKIAMFQATSRRKYERELSDARQELGAANASLRETAKLRDEFVAILGHDLRNPLASIGSGLRILSKEELTPKGRKVADLIEGSVNRMAGLIDDILDLSKARLGGGLKVLKRIAPDLASEIRQVISEVETGSGRSIVTRLDLPHPVVVDSARITQLLSNLLGNAISHGASDRPVEVSAEVKDGHLKIEVSNGGDPIPEDTLPRLFQPFFRGNDTAGTQGLGLGLHISSEIAKAHGGTLTVTSSSERTTFLLRVPADGYSTVGRTAANS